jgi:hypothetical protein
MFSHYLRTGQQHPTEFLGVRNSATTKLPFKFQELELVGTFYLDIMFVPYLFYYLLPKTQTWNTPLWGQKWGPLKFELFGASTRAVNRERKPYKDAKLKLHQGRVSERSKKAGWHHVRYYTSQATRPIPIHM